MVNANTLKDTLINFPFCFDEMAVDHAVAKVENSLTAMTIIESWLKSIDSRKRGGEDLKDLFFEAENLAYAWRRDLHENMNDYSSADYLHLEKSGVELIRFCVRMNIVFYA